MLAMLRRNEKGAYSPIGIDIGTRSVKMVQLRKSRDGVTLHAAALREIRGEEANDAVAMAKILKELRSEAPFVNRTAVSRMPHSQVSIIPIKLDGRGEAIETIVTREAGKYLSYPLEEAVLDYISVQQSSPEGQKVLLVATRRSDVDQHLTLVREAGFHPQAIDVGPNALLRTFRFLADRDERRVLLINVGGRQTFFTILWDGVILIDRQIPWGEDLLVERLSTVLQIEEDEARRMLYTYGINPQAGTFLFPREDMEVLSEEAISGAIFEITAKDLEGFATEAEKILIYCASENRGAMVDQTYLMGGSTYLLGSGPFVKNFHLFLEKRLGIQVKTLDPFRRFQEKCREPYNPSLFGVSIGLALRGLEQDGA